MNNARMSILYHIDELCIILICFFRLSITISFYLKNEKLSAAKNLVEWHFEQYFISKPQKFLKEDYEASRETEKNNKSE